MYLITKLLEKVIESQTPKNTDAVILIDGFFLVHLMKELPKIIRKVLKKI